jgi:glutaredoxin
MAQNKISIPLKDIHEDSASMKELKRIGGKTQVPCLVIDGKALYESENIVEWFKKNWPRRPP